MTQKPRQIAEQLAEIQQLDTAALRIKWLEVFGRPAPRRLGRDMLMRAVAYRIQEKEYGGLRPATVRRLHRIAQDLREGRGIEPAPSTTLQQGVRLMREWNGETHFVEVLAKGFEWKGTVYASLSAVARAITGSRWSGPRFFGLLDDQKETSNPRLSSESNS